MLYRPSKRGNRLRNRFNVSLWMARKKGTPVDIDGEFLLDMFVTQNGRCALTGIRMEEPNGYMPSGGKATSISVDRIDPSLGYVEGNVRLICHCVNMFKGRMTDDEMYAVAEMLLQSRGRGT